MTLSRAEPELAGQAPAYDEVVEQAGVLITTLDAQTRIVGFNTKCEQLTGASRSSMLGTDWVNVFVPASDRARVREMLRQTVTKQTPHAYEGPLHSTEGELMLRWHFSALAHDGCVCAIGIDMSREHELSVRTRRAERLTSLGLLAGGFAHELRNPLNAAKLQLDLARRRLSKAASHPRSGAQQALELADQELQRMAALVDDFLIFARPHQLQLTTLDLHTLLGEVRQVIQPEADAAGVTLQVLAGDPLRITVDAALIKQALYHLMRNAIEASPPRGLVRVSVYSESGHVSLTIEDEGAGFALDAPIFEPFYTTKSDGTGLGLAIAHRIVMDHAGSIEATSQPGCTAFVMALPIVPARRTKRQPTRSLLRLRP